MPSSASCETTCTPPSRITMTENGSNSVSDSVVLPARIIPMSRSYSEKKKWSSTTGCAVPEASKLNRNSTEVPTCTLTSPKPLDSLLENGSCAVYADIFPITRSTTVPSATVVTLLNRIVGGFGRPPSPSESGPSPPRLLYCSSDPSKWSVVALRIQSTNGNPHSGPLG